MSEQNIETAQKLSIWTKRGIFTMSECDIAVLVGGLSWAAGAGDHTAFHLIQIWSRLACDEGEIGMVEELLATTLNIFGGVIDARIEQEWGEECETAAMQQLWLKMNCQYVDRRKLAKQEKKRGRKKKI